MKVPAASFAISCGLSQEEPSERLFQAIVLRHGVTALEFALEREDMLFPRAD